MLCDYETTNTHHKYKNMSNNTSAFNICDSFFTTESFLDVCKHCNQLLSLFEEQLSRRLANFYGKDVRYDLKVEETAEKLAEKNYTWILEGRKAD